MALAKGLRLVREDLMARADAREPAEKLAKSRKSRVEVIEAPWLQRSAQLSPGGGSESSQQAS